MIPQSDGYTIEVFPGIHSMGATKKHAVPGHCHVPPAPTKIADMPEGDRLPMPPGSGATAYAP